MARLGHLLSVLGLVLCGATGLGLSAPPAPTPKKPIIGILMQKCHNKNMRALGKYYIAASYVKFLESAGARVVPVRLDLKNEEYEKLFKSINGFQQRRGQQVSMTLTSGKGTLEGLGLGRTTSMGVIGRAAISSEWTFL